MGTCLMGMTGCLSPKLRPPHAEPKTIDDCPSLGSAVPMKVRGPLAKQAPKMYQPSEDAERRQAKPG